MPTEIKLLHAIWVAGKPRRVDDVVTVDYATAKYLEGLGRAEIIAPEDAVEDAVEKLARPAPRKKKQSAPAPALEADASAPAGDPVDLGDLLTPMDPETTPPASVPL